MLFAFIGQDKPGHLQLRMDRRPQHIDFLNGLNAAGTLKFAGPLLDDKGDPCGSLVVVEADDAAAAETMLAGDPYAKAGLFGASEIKGWKWVFNNPQSA